jgi:hypothetical protein
VSISLIAAQRSGDALLLGGFDNATHALTGCMQGTGGAPDGVELAEAATAFADNEPSTWQYRTAASTSRAQPRRVSGSWLKTPPKVSQAAATFLVWRLP